MRRQPSDDAGQPGTVYLLHIEPAYRHARHYLAFSTDPPARVAEHIAGHGSPLIRAAIAAGCAADLAAACIGTRALERRLKRWKGSAAFCPRCALPGRRTRLDELQPATEIPA